MKKTLQVVAALLSIALLSEVLPAQRAQAQEWTGGSLSLLSFTDDSATTGNRTVNKVRGISAVAGAASTITITNSYVSTTSTVLCVIQTNDATAILKNCVPGSGSFAITLTANATGTTKVAWVVLN